MSSVWVRLCTCIVTHNSYINYDRLNSQSKTKNRHILVERTNLPDIREHINVEHRTSDLNTERQICLTHITTVTKHQHKKSGYYLGSIHIQPTSIKSGPLVQTPATSVDFTVASGERYVGGHNNSIIQHTHILSTGPNRSHLPRFHTRVESKKRPRPDRGHILRIYGVKWDEDELSLSAMLSDITNSHDVDCRFTRIQFVEGQRRERSGRRRNSTKVRCCLPRCLGVWSKSDSLHKFCQSGGRGRLRKWDNGRYKRPIVWKTFPRNTHYAMPGKSVSTPVKPLGACKVIQRPPHSFIARLNRIPVRDTYRLRDGIATGRSKMRVQQKLGFRTAILNIQGLAGKFADISATLHHMNVDLLALQETWKHRKWTIDVPGYT